jgi:hypothetical protein
MFSKIAAREMVLLVGLGTNTIQSNGKLPSVEEGSVEEGSLSIHELYATGNRV